MSTSASVWGRWYSLLSSSLQNPPSFQLRTKVTVFVKVFNYISVVTLALKVESKNKRQDCKARTGLNENSSIVKDNAKVKEPLVLPDRIFKEVSATGLYWVQLNFVTISSFVLSFEHGYKVSHPADKDHIVISLSGSRQRMCMFYTSIWSNYEVNYEVCNIQTVP